jgi:hypothetical protein
MGETRGSIDATRRSFRVRWWLANAAGFTAAHVVYSLIGHGFTGAHGDQLTSAQYLAHTVALIATAVIIFALQRRAMRHHVRVGGTRMVVATAVFVTAFWLGAETTGPPADWILGFTVLGTASWIGVPSLAGFRLVWAAMAVVGFWTGIAAAAAVIGLLIWTGLFYPESDTLFNHTVFWVLLGGITGAAGGYVSGWPLSWAVVARDGAQQAV